MQMILAIVYGPDGLFQVSSLVKIWMLPLVPA
jgi:hypothetical protein